MTTPHASWAVDYDLIYDQSFGFAYHALTDLTLEVVKNSVPAPAKIIDFGAGTGRLCLPLLLGGYDIIAVEPCLEMLNQLSHKCSASACTNLVTFNGTMQAFKAESSFDMAICVFTVISYLLDEDALKKSIKSAYLALKVGGLLLIDIPLRFIFSGYTKNTAIMQREVIVTAGQNDIYAYQENTTVRKDGEVCHYLDNFEIKYWDIDTVLNALFECGFVVINDLSAAFAGTGSRYFLLEKQGNFLNKSIVL